MVVLRAEREEGWLILGYTPRPPLSPTLPQSEGRGTGRRKETT